MFGFNAGGGSYLPRQGSFVIQPAETFFGLTGPGVVKSVLGEDVTPDELGGPGVHGASGVADLTVPDEVSALRTAKRLLSYLPGNAKSSPPYQATSDSIDRPTDEIDTLLRTAFTSPHGFQHAGRRRHLAAEPMRSRRLLRSSTSARAQHGDGFRSHRRPRHRVRREQQRGGVRPDRRRRGVQKRALHPVLQPLQHSPAVHRRHHGIPAGSRARDPRHRARRSGDARRDRRCANPSDSAAGSQRLRRGVCVVQQLPHRCRLGDRVADHPGRGHGTGRQRVRLQKGTPAAASERESEARGGDRSASAGGGPIRRPPPPRREPTSTPG